MASKNIFDQALALSDIRSLFIMYQPIRNIPLLAS